MKATWRSEFECNPEQFSAEKLFWKSAFWKEAPFILSEFKCPPQTDWAWERSRMISWICGKLMIIKIKVKWEKMTSHLKNLSGSRYPIRVSSLPHADSEKPAVVVTRYKQSPEWCKTDPENLCDSEDLESHLQTLTIIQYIH